MEGSEGVPWRNRCRNSNSLASEHYSSFRKRYLLIVTVLPGLAETLMSRVDVTSVSDCRI
jgi:hypothetical protein